MGDIKGEHGDLWFVDTFLIIFVSFLQFRFDKPGFIGFDMMFFCRSQYCFLEESFMNVLLAAHKIVSPSFCQPTISIGLWVVVKCVLSSDWEQCITPISCSEEGFQRDLELLKQARADRSASGHFAETVLFFICFLLFVSGVGLIRMETTGRQYWPLH